MTGQQLKDIYNTSGITGEAFADKIGVSRARLYQIFKEAEVSQEIIDKLSNPVDKDNNKQTVSLPLSGVNPSAVREMELLKKELEFKTREVELLNMLLAEKIKNEKTSPVVETALEESLEKRLKAIEGNILLLFKSEAEYKKAMAYLDKPLPNVSICVADPFGKILSVNDEFTKQTGYSRNEVIGKKPGAVLQGQNTDQDSVKKMREAMLNKKYFEGEVINYNKNGEEIKCKLTITPVKDKSGKLEKFISLAVFSKVNVLKYN